MVATKSKGSAAERELLHTLVSHGFAVVRAAGSGSTSVDACDLVAGTAGKAFAIEVKACVASRQYFQDEQMKELQRFADAFGAQPILAVKWTRRGWGIAPLAKADNTGKMHAISQAQMQPLDEWIKIIRLGFDVH